MALGLNLFKVTVDPATIAAIEASDFLRAEFAVYEKRTTVRNDSTYSGLYLYGRNSYFEIFDSSAKPVGPPSEIALAVDEPGELAKYGGEPPKTITRNWNRTDVPWFLMRTYHSPETGQIEMFGMEYLPEYLQQWNAQAATPVGIKRSDVMARYQAVLRARWDQRLLEDVTRVTVALVEPELAAFRKAAGPRGVLDSGLISAVAVQGPRQGVVRADFRLTRDLKTQYVLPFGSTKLTLGPGRLGHWLY